MERECGVCMDQYDNCNKIPKELRCGHTFCEQCLIEVLGGNKKSSSIVCPNCRRQTTYVTDIKSLPTNRRFLTTNINLDQPLHNPLNEEGILCIYIFQIIYIYIYSTLSGKRDQRTRDMHGGL